MKENVHSKQEEVVALVEVGLLKAAAYQMTLENKIMGRLLTTLSLGNLYSQTWNIVDDHIITVIKEARHLTNISLVKLPAISSETLVYMGQLSFKRFSVFR
jgi:hypothetical protein